MTEGEQIAVLEQKMISIEHRVKSLEELIQKQNDLVISVNRLALNMENMLSEQKAQGERLKNLEQEPAERWNSMQKTAFTTIVGVVAGAIAAGILQMIAASM